MEYWVSHVFKHICKCMDFWGKYRWFGIYTRGNFHLLLLDMLHYTSQSQYFKTSHVWNHIPFSCGLVLDHFRGRYLNTRVYVSMTKLNYKDQTKY